MAEPRGSASSTHLSPRKEGRLPGFKHAATALYLQDVYDGRTIAQFKDSSLGQLIDTALVQHAVKDVGGAGAGTDADPSFLPISLGGFPL